MSESVLIVGAGAGLRASLARLCNSNGMKVVLAARNIKKLDSLKEEINYKGEIHSLLLIILHIQYYKRPEIYLDALAS